MKKLLIAAILSMIATAALAQTVQEIPLYQCKDNETHKLLATIGLVKKGLKVRIDDAVLIITFKDIEAYKSLAQLLDDE